MGVLAGFFRWLDGPLMRLVDLFLALPLLPLLLVVILLFRDTLRAAFGPEIGIFILIVAVIGITSWMQTARIVRGEVLALREQEYVLAARSIGTRPRRIITRHILPNVLSPIMVSAGVGRGQRDPAGKCVVFPGAGVPVRFSDLGPVAVRWRKLHDTDAGAGDLARAGNLADGAERQLHRRRVARRAGSADSGALTP